MKPVVLLVPGTLCDREVWADVADALAGEAEIRIADVTRQASVPAMVADAWELLRDLPAGHPVVLGGFSLGGYVAIEMLSAPRRPLQAAALVSTSARPEAPDALPQRERVIRALQNDFPTAVEATLNWTTERPAPALRQRLARMMGRVGAEAAVRQTRAVMARADHRAALSALALPVRVLCGESDRVTPPALARELAGLVPDARLEIVPGAGHMLPAEQPAAVARALGEWLQGFQPREGDRP